jgi:hypothetical protein
MNNDSGGYLVTKKYSYYVFVLLFLLYMFNYMDRMVVVSIFPFLHDDWGVSDTQCGLLAGAGARPSLSWRSCGVSPLRHAGSPETLHSSLQHAP